MNARRLILGLATLATFMAGTSFAADDPYMHKMPDARGQRSSTRSHSVAPGGMSTAPMMMRRSYGFRILNQSQNTHFRADHKIPGLYFAR